jgi:probable O-glycosylation ligase (exosortase A-associated)
MRDIALTLVFIGLVFWSFKRPVIAPLLWAWLSLMSPHRLTWGFAYNMPFAQIAAAVVLVMLFASKERYPYPGLAPARLLIAFYMWMCVTSLLSFNDSATVLAGWIKVTKVQVMLFLSLLMLRGRRHIDMLVWVIVLSIGFYGVKGGIHTILRGGGSMVMGPPGSFIEGTNDIALAMVMVIPLMYYLATEARNKWIVRGLFTMMVITGLAVLGTTSRGALLAVLTMATLLGMKSRRRTLTVVLLAVCITGMFAFMPDQWAEKMGTIQTHEDHSAQSRIYTWQMIWNMVLHHPITGGGFLITENPLTWQRYAVTEYAKAYSPHSIYFQALAEHGFVGLGLYLALWIATWRSCARIIKQAVTPETHWAGTLARMLQASIAGFAVGGAFVNLLNYDLPYYLIGVVVLTELALREQLRSSPASVPVGLGATASGVRHAR